MTIGCSLFACNGMGQGATRSALVVQKLRGICISPVTRTLPNSSFGTTFTRFLHHSGISGAETPETAAVDSITQIRLPAIDFVMLEKGSKAKFTVSIEGNIGSGKSTLLQHFKSFSDVDVLKEPVHKWRDVRGYNLLDLMYKDPCRWAHTFQTYVQMTMLEVHLKSTSSPVKLIERSLFSARHCFVENLYRTKKMSDPEYAVYCEWYKTMTENLDVGLDLIVYLRTDPTLLHERIKQRARTEEQAIPLQYLQDLHGLHEEWLIEKKHGLSTPVLVLDANDSLPAMYKKFEEHTADILCKKLDKPKSDAAKEEVVTLVPQVVATAASN